MLPQEKVRNFGHWIKLAFYETFPEDHINSITANKTKLYKLIKILPLNIQLKTMKDNITDFNDTVAKTALLQDCFKE